MICFVVSPLVYLLQLVDKENTLTLRCVGRLHDPGGVRVALELFNKYRVVAWQHVSHGYHVHVNVVAIGVLLGNRVALLLHVLSPSLDILNHQILPRELEVVRKMIDQPA